jgi:hypothetical protein
MTECSKKNIGFAAVVLGLLTLLGGTVSHLPPAFAQVPPVALEVLAAGFTPDRHIRIRTTGPSDILQTRIVVQPGVTRVGIRIRAR